MMGVSSDTESNEHTHDEDGSQSPKSTQRTRSDTSTDDEGFDEPTSGERAVSAMESTDSECSDISSDQETPLKRLRRCHPKLDKNMSKDTFRDLLMQLESEESRQLLYPPSLWKHPNNISPDTEYKNIDEIAEYQRQNPGCESPNLESFCVYHGLNHKNYPGQYAMLHEVALRKGKETYLLDAAFVLNGRNTVLQQVELVAVEVSKLGAGCRSCRGEIWATIKLSPERQMRARLQKPASDYQRFWTDFCWIANFAKYSVDYFTIAEQEGRLITIDDFKIVFLERISSMHKDCPEFKQWIRRLDGYHDVRRQLSKLAPFIFRHFHKTTDPSSFLSHPCWNEIGCTKRKRIKVEGEPTVVTRKVAAAFLIPFREWKSEKGKLLDQVSYSSTVKALREDRMRTIELPNKFGASQRDNFRTQNEITESKVEWTLNEAVRKNFSHSCLPEELLNKLVVIRQREKTKRYFDYALVTQITRDKKKVRIVWLTLPSDTFGKDKLVYKTSTNQRAFYPIGNELFFSDDCNCYAISIADIVGVYNISILEDYQGQPCEFFAIHQYLEKEQCVVKTTRSQLGFMCSSLCEQLPQKASHRTVCSTKRRKRRSGTPSTNSLPSIPSTQTLTNVSLFSGCGLFDRALESTGDIRTILSVDSDPLAIRSARANASHTATQEFVHGSVNQVLREIMTGERPYLHADSLTAGSPCQGFSAANNKKKMSEKSLRECSLVASVVAWIETILPGYVVIENVPGMDWGSTSACKQVIFCLLSFGYQVRKFTLNAEDYGGSTIRKRLFVVAAAPKYQLPQCPRPTHGSGLKARVTIKDTVSDLTPIHNDTTVNIERPYHIPLQRLSPHITSHRSNLRALLHKIPVNPPARGLIDIRATLTGPHRSWFQSLSALKKRPNSQLMKRVEANGFFRTIVTAPHPLCFHGGQQIHYDQHRLLSLEEVARAQGVPHDFVLLGHSAQKLKQVGNAVPWCFGEAIGKEIARARGLFQPVTAPDPELTNSHNSSLAIDIEGSETATDHEQATTHTPSHRDSVLRYIDLTTPSPEPACAAALEDGQQPESPPSRRTKKRSSSSIDDDEMIGNIDVERSRKRRG